MSDSEDTDSLMSVATPSGLKNFLGLTVEEMTLHIDSLNSTRVERVEEKNNGVEEEEQNQKERLLGSNEGILSQLAEWSDSDPDLNDNDDDDAKSDSGSEVSTASTDSITLLLPQTTDSKVPQEDGKKASAKIKESALQLQLYETAAPSPLQLVPLALEAAENEEAFPKLQNGAQFSNSTSSQVLEFTYDKYKSPNYGVRVSPGFGAQGLDFLRPSPNSGWRYLPGSEKDPQIIARAPNFRTPGGYKPPENPTPPRDLTEEQIQEEVKQMYAFPDTDIKAQYPESGSGDRSGVSIIDSANTDTTQPVDKDFIKTPAVPVLMPGSNGEGDNHGVNQVESQIIPNPSCSSKPSFKEETEIDGGGSSSKCDSVTVSGAGPVGGKSVKRKLFSAGDTVGSVPDYGFGLRDIDKLEVREKPVVASHSWVSGHQPQLHEQSHSRNQIQINRSNISSNSKPNVSFAQFRDDNNLEISPIKAAYLDKNGLSPDISRCLPRRRHENRNVVRSPRKVNLLELDLLWRDIQHTKFSMESDIQKSSECLKAMSSSASTFTPSSISEALTSLDHSLLSKNQDKVQNQKQPHGIAKVSFQDSCNSPSEEQRPNSHPKFKGQSADIYNDERRQKQQKKKSILKSKLQAIAHPARTRSRSPDLSKGTDISFDLSGATDNDDVCPTGMSNYDTSSVFPTDLDTIDLSSILSAAQLKASEFEDILGKLDDLTDVTWEEINGADDEIETVVTKLEVSDWAKSGANEYLQKYHEEKFKREHCEEEIANLQKTVLRLTEESAVRDKMVSKKDLVLLKMSKAWNEVTEQWKAHEVHSKMVLEKLQLNQVTLTDSLRQSKERIDDYEKELANAVELAASFKLKLENLEGSKCDIVSKLERENSDLKKHFSDLTVNLDSIKMEKDTAVRALNESQKQLDERSAAHTAMQQKLSILEEETTEERKDLEDVKEQNKALEIHLKCVTVKKNSLEGELVDLTEKLKIEHEEKERLKSNLNLEIERKVKEEADRLHDYYNLKLQEALQCQSQKMMMTERQIVGEQQRQLNHLEKDMMMKLQECKTRCIAETNKMKSKYEKEIKKLRQDVSQKQLFISTISHQLQSYEQSEHTKGHFKPATMYGQSATDGMSLNFCSNQKQIVTSDVSVVSSSCNSTTGSSTPKYEVHVRQQKTVTGSQKGVHAVTDDHHNHDRMSAAEDFYPSKLSRYNTSTPNSIVVEAPLLGNLKGWRELPNIQHLLHPFEEQEERQSQQPQQHNNKNVSQLLHYDQEQCDREETSGIADRLLESTHGNQREKFLQSFLSEDILDNPRKLDSNGIRELPNANTITEQGLQRCIQTLVKCYSERRSLNNSKAGCSASETVVAATTTTASTTAATPPTVTAPSNHNYVTAPPDNNYNNHVIQTCKILRSPFISSSKMIKDSTNSCITNSGRNGASSLDQMIGLDQSGTGSGPPDFKTVPIGVNFGRSGSGHDEFGNNIGFKQGKQMKPPWK